MVREVWDRAGVAMVLSEGAAEEGPLHRDRNSCKGFLHLDPASGRCGGNQETKTDFLIRHVYTIKCGWWWFSC